MSVTGSGQAVEQGEAVITAPDAGSSVHQTSGHPTGSGVVVFAFLDQPNPYDAACLDQRSFIDNFSGFNARTNAPFGDNAAWASSVNWKVVGHDITGPLVFPGFNDGLGTNRITPGLDSGNNKIYVTLTTAPNNPAVGVFKEITRNHSTINRIRPVPVGQYEFGPMGTPLAGSLSYIDIKVDDDTYHSDLTGAGTYHYSQLERGNTGDWIEVSGGSAKAHMAGPGNWQLQATGLNDVADTLWYRDILRLRYRFQFNRLSDSSARVSFRFGDYTLTVAAPGADYSPGLRGDVTLASSTASVSEVRPDLSPVTWLIAEFAVDLTANTVRGRVYQDGLTPGAFLSLATAGERYGDASYEPPLAVGLTNTDASPWEVWVDYVSIDVASDDPIGLFPLGYVALDTSFADPWGYVKSWDTPDPMDGRSYAVAFGTDSFSFGTNGLPEMAFQMVWGLFGDWGPGTMQSITQVGVSWRLPTTVPSDLGGGPFNPDDWQFILEGDITVFIAGTHATGFPVNDATFTVVIKSNNYDEVAPYFYEYSALGGAESYHTFTINAEQPPTYQHFRVAFTNNGSNGGVTPAHFQWTVEFLGDVIEQLRSAGPGQGFFLPNLLSVLARFRNVEATAIRKNPQLHAVPCTPPDPGTLITETR